MGETAASLELLKGSKKEAVEKALSTPKVEQNTADEEIEVDIDIDSLDMAAINELTEKYSLDVPSNWASLSLDKKKEWLRSQVEETPAEPETTEVKATAVTATPTVVPKNAALDFAEQDGPVVESTSKPEKKTKAAKPKKEKSTAVVKSEALTGEIVDGDLIVDIVHEVETMNEQDARDTVAALSDNTEKTFFKLGGVLSVILKNKWYEPYGHFRDLVENEYGIHYRKAMYWISIYDHLVESKVPWSKVKGIGWAKLKELADIITIDNVDEWVQIANSQPQLKFMETVKSAKASDKPQAITDQTASATMNKTFKVHSGQKETIEAAINKAKEESNTSVDTVALENICLEYLGGVTLTHRLQKMGIDAALKALEEAFPDANLNIEVVV